MQIGEQEAAAIISKGPRATNDLFHFWSLRRQNDERVNSITLEEFVEMKENGIFPDYDPLDDNRLKQMVHEEEYNVLEYEPELIDMNQLDMMELTEMFLL